VKIELVLDAKAIIGESPLWVPPENALYWADIKAPALHRFHPASGETRRWNLPADIGGYALDGYGRALVALRTGLDWLDLKTGELTQIVASPFDTALIRFNEAACDSHGRFWVGTMTDPRPGILSEQTGLLHSFTTAEGLIPHADFAFITNGMAWNADESFFYISHSLEKVIYEHRYDVTNGMLGAQREFARFHDTPGIPDGAAIDMAGNYWCANHGGGCLHRYAPSGALETVILLPVSQPTMCCFAGTDLQTLYVTSAREKLSPAALAQEPYAGGLFKLTPPIPGQPRSWRVS
jgi:sugar lactone lactonase YvrE